MSTTKNRVLRVCAGVTCLAIGLLALLWFITQFTPGTPKTLEAENFTTSIGANGTNNNHFASETIIDIPFNQTYHAEGITQGKKFGYTEEELAFWSDEQQKRSRSASSWVHELSNLDITLTAIKVVTEDAFIEWYPHYGDVRPSIGKPQTWPEAKVLLTEATITNNSDKVINIPSLQLWSEDFNGASANLSSGLFSEKYLLEELYGEPSDRGLNEYHLSDNWNVIQPGETLTRTLPYLVYRGLFKSTEDFDTFDYSRMCLTLSDFDPPTLYRLWLG